MVNLYPNYRKTVEYYSGTNADIQRVLEKNFISARKAVEKDNFYKKFEGSDIRETARNVWNYLKDNVPYKEDGILEQKIKMPPRLLADARAGIGTDCKSYALFSCAILSHYCPVSFRYTSYTNDPTPTHVYCVCNGGDIIVDAVWNKFDDEKDYKYKYDKPMKISTLSGIKNKTEISPEYYDMISFYDNARKATTPGTHKRKLMDLYWSATLKSALADSNNPDPALLNEVNKVYAKSVKGAGDALAIGAIKKPDWATSGDRNTHLLFVANPAMVASRASFLALSELNAFGIIDRLISEENKGDHRISRWWYRSGGDPAVLWKFLNKNKSKKAFFGVDKKVMDLINKIKSKIGIKGYDEYPLGQVVTAAGASAGASATIATITACIPLLTSLMAVIGDVFNKVKEIKTGTTPGTTPEIDPGTTPGDTGAGINNKYLLYGGIGLLLVGGIYYVTKKSKK